MYQFLVEGQFYDVSIYPTTQDRMALVVKYPDTGKWLASLSWHQVTGEIKFVKVYVDELRRHGIATAMLKLARELYPNPPIVHSPCRTADGEHWAQSTGDTLPPLDALNLGWAA